MRRSYRDPVLTFATNVMGTANVFEACRQRRQPSGVVVVTTDKCYENQEWDGGYRETDPLGGHDPYSASKACAEIVCGCYRAFFPRSADLLASARAGNVIGGGDWSEDRLVPDFVRAVARPVLEVRTPARCGPGSTCSTR